MPCAAHVTSEFMKIMYNFMTSATYNLYVYRLQRKRIIASHFSRIEFGARRVDVRNKTQRDFVSYSIDPLCQH